MFKTHALDLHEIRSVIGSSLGLKDLASCARVSQDWNNSFTPQLYNSVVLSKHGPSLENVEKNWHLIQHLEIQNSEYEELLSTSARDKVIFSIISNSILTTLLLGTNSIGEIGAQALSDALKANSTLTILDLSRNSIGLNGAQALSNALKSNSAQTTLRLGTNSLEKTELRRWLRHSKPTRP
ncbi:hypothetical protein BGZ80_005512 [Entomortierella chlamydospora]|uniref:RNI-like protein n=1 Tax=Entomortierella chlamydospora TaxID=101097 RepID=A0A9P6SUR6_9FUNG|nr:hypothetical protein BGZ80_005512 [Entomortierella chlamydospora]